MTNVVVLENQSLFDIALMVSGSAEAVFDLAIENDLSITDNLTPKQILKFTAMPINKKVVDYYKTNNIIPATTGETEEHEGIFDKTFDKTFE